MRTVEPLKDPAEGVWIDIATAAGIRHQADWAAGEPFPLAVKANIAVREMQRSAGTPALEIDRQEADAPVVAAFRAAGAIVVGTTNMHELAFGITSNNGEYGPVRLPGHPERSAGGSSGGSAAAVADGSVPFALGTDTGGSVSIPASLCGVVGFRPTTGRWPNAGLVGLSWTRDTTGVFTRSVADAIRADGWVTADRPAPTATGRPRIGLPAQLLADLDPHTAAAVDAALERLGDAAEFVEVDLGDVLDCTHRAEMPLVLWESHALLGDVARSALGEERPGDALDEMIELIASPDVRAILEAEVRDPVRPEAYAAAQRDTIDARVRYAHLLDTHGLDALAFPATPAPAPRIGEDETVEHLGERVSTFGLYTRNTGQGTVVGVPMVTVPLPVGADELPVGLTLQGRRFGDSAVLALAAAVEAVVAG